MVNGFQFNIFNHEVNAFSFIVMMLYFSLVFQERLVSNLHDLCKNYTVIIRTYQLEIRSSISRI